MLVSVCIPMYNEALFAEGCSGLADTFTKKLKNDLGCDVEFVFCDDGSTDGTGELLRKFISDMGYANQKVVGYEKNRGKGGALKEAVSHTKGDIVMYTDTDLAYGLDNMQKVVAEVMDGAPVVTGSRRLEKNGYGKYTLFRRIASAAYVKVISVYAGFRLSDSQCGLKAFRGDIARDVFKDLEMTGFSFDLEVIMRIQKKGFEIKEVPVSIVNHRGATSKVHVVRDSVKMLKDVKRIKKIVNHLPN